MSPPLSVTGRRWVLADVDAASVDRLAAHLPRTAARCLARRLGSAPASAWLAPSLDHLHDPWSMAGMSAGVERIRRAITDGERMRIVTDYDVDGTTSSLILQNTLKLLGAGDRVDYHIPDRMVEGYGFSVQAAQAARDDGIGLIITADIGVRDHAAVDAAADAGVDVVICDHHLPDGASVPARAAAVLCPPQAGCDYPNPALAACGVSVKLAQALLAEHPRRDAIVQSMLKVAAIGTVADVVDLSTLENRAIVSLGLDGLRRGPHAPGLHALLEVAGLSGEHIDAGALGFRLGPRINAAGRLDTATLVVELFQERDISRARARAANLDRLNKERQSIQRRLTDQALAAVATSPPPFVLAWGPEPEGWHRGVVGIVAAKMRDRLHRPVAVASVLGETATGSVRSLPGVHAVAALDAAKDLLVRYGGHPVAAGFTVPTAALPALAERLAAWAAAQVDEAAFVPVIEVDATCAVEVLTPRLTTAIERLGPYGKGNPAPLLLLEQVQAHGARPMGDRHLRFSVGEVDAVWWGGREHADRLQAGPADLVVRLGFNRWKGRARVRLTVEDALLSPDAAASPRGPAPVPPAAGPA